MSFETFALLVGTFGGLTGLAALLNSLTKAQNSSVEQLRNLVKEYRVEVTLLRERIKVLEGKSEKQAARIACLEEEVEYWRDKYNELAAWVREKLGIENSDEIIE